jgi:hypothetical protein
LLALQVCHQEVEQSHVHVNIVQVQVAAFLEFFVFNC